MLRPLFAVAMALVLADGARAEDLYFPLDAFDPEVLEALPLDSLAYAGASRTLTIVMPASIDAIDRATEPALEEGLIACINGKAMFRENGRRRFLDAGASLPYCSG